MTELRPVNAFEDRVVLVTGAGSGIGRAAAELFAERGAAVVAADLDEAGAETVASIEKAGGTAVFVQADVSVERDIGAVVDAVVTAHGRLDVAFNNAGIAPPLSAIEELHGETWDRAHAVNLRSVWLCMKYELAAMVPRQRGRSSTPPRSRVCSAFHAPPPTRPPSTASSG